jgi:hypothetical protein
MWKGSFLAVALILITAVCVMGCSAEVCNLPEVHGSCHQHSQSSTHPAGHECFHKAVSPEQASTFTPLSNMALLPIAVLIAPRIVDFPGYVVPAVVESPPVVDPALTLRI